MTENDYLRLLLVDVCVDIFHVSSFVLLKNHQGLFTLKDTKGKTLIAPSDHIRYKERYETGYGNWEVLTSEELKKQRDVPKKLPKLR